MQRTTILPAIALGLLAGVLVAASVALLPNTALGADASGAWLTLAGLGLIGSAAGLFVLVRRDRLGR